MAGDISFAEYADALPSSAVVAPHIRIRRHAGQLIADGLFDFAQGFTRRATISATSDPFASWHWDGVRLVVRNDRYGFSPLFYCADDDRVIVSPSLATLLALGAPTDIDYTALGTLLRLSFLLGDDSVFRHIRMLPPAAQFNWSATGHHVSGSYVLGKPDGISRDAALDGYIDLFRSAMRNYVAPRQFAVPLSGGRDSRHIFLELCESGNPPDAAITVRYEPTIQTEDVAVAGKLAAAAGVRHVVLDGSPSLAIEWQKNLQTGFCTYEHGWVMAMAAHLQGRYAAAYDGVGGDLLSTGLANTERRQGLIEKGDFGGLADSFLIDDGALHRMLRPMPAALASREAVRDRFVREFQRHADAPNPLGSFLFWNRARRVTSLSPACILGRATEIWCPYLDRQLFDFLVTLPARLLLNEKEYHRFHTDAILRGYPRFAQIPFSAKLPERKRHAAYARALCYELLAKALETRRMPLLRASYVFSRVGLHMVHPGQSIRAPERARDLLYLIQVGSTLRPRARARRPFGGRTRAA